MPTAHMPLICTSACRVQSRIKRLEKDGKSVMDELKKVRARCVLGAWFFSMHFAFHKAS